MSNRESIVQACLDSECVKAEVKYAEAGGYRISKKVRLYKALEDMQVRVVFPAETEELEEGSVLAITCLYDLEKQENIYGHTICAGPGVNVLLRAIHSPLGKATPQPGQAGDKAVLRFVAWKQAAWGKFLNDELDLGNKEASAIFIRSFWKALDRMFAGGVLQDVPKDWHWQGD